MRASLIFLLLSTMSMAQPAPTGGVKVQGACNQVVAGNGNQVTLNCNGISKEKAAQLVRLLNTIISRQLDPDEVYAQLNQISAKVDSINVSIDPLTGMPQEEQNIFLTAHRLYSDCMAAARDWNLARFSNSANSADQVHTARYRAELEPQLLKSRAQMLALSPDSSPMSGPDYDTVSNARQLAAVCQDLSRVGLNAYNSESQRVRNNVVRPAQPPPH